MEIKVVAGDITQIAAGAIIVNLFEGVERPGGATAAVDQALGGVISQLIAEGEIRGKEGEVTLLHTLGRLPATRVAVVGLGKQADLSADGVRSALGEACRSLRRARVQQAATIVHGAGAGGLDPLAAVQAITEGALLGLYAFKKHMEKDPKEKDLQELLIVEQDQARAASLEPGVHQGRVLSEATNLARDLSNEPANVITPSALAEAAQGVAQETGLECTVLGPEEIKGLGMGGLLGVAQGSQQPPRFIVLRYRGNGGGTTLGLLGKGITFDSGGISLKPSEGMGDMKGDMAGGAAVIAAMGAIARLKPRINVVGLVPATENMPGGSALKPGDIIKAMNGKSIEIVSTDAEGRLTLADALCYARKEGLSPVLDAATLTGACHIALGDICSGAFSNNPAFQEKVLKAGERAGERHWPLPMFDEYKEYNKSDVADIKNAGPRWGGAISAARFLAEFIGDTPWVHLDIAGTSRSEKERGYVVKGATGVPTRTMVHLALMLAEEPK